MRSFGASSTLFSHKSPVKLSQDAAVPSVFAIFLIYPYKKQGADIFRRCAHVAHLRLIRARRDQRHLRLCKPVSRSC